MIDRMTGDYFASLILAILGFGVANAFLLVGRPARTTVWFSMSYSSVGLTFLGAAFFLDNVPEDHTPLWARLTGLVSLVVSATTLMYIKALAETIPRSEWLGSGA